MVEPFVRVLGNGRAAGLADAEAVFGDVSEPGIVLPIQRHRLALRRGMSVGRQRDALADRGLHQGQYGGQELRVEPVGFRFRFRQWNGGWLIPRFDDLAFDAAVGDEPHEGDGDVYEVGSPGGDERDRERGRIENHRELAFQIAADGGF